MSGRETKLKKILTRLEEIEQLQSDLRRILPLETNRKVVRKAWKGRTPNELPLPHATSDSENSSEASDIKYSDSKPTRSVSRAPVSVSVQTLKDNESDNFYVLDDLRRENHLPESALNDSVKSFKLSPVGLEHDEPSDTSIEKVAKSINASVQTKKKNKANTFEAFDILDYFRIANTPQDRANVDCATNNGIAKSINACVQTATKQGVATKPFGTLNYCHLPDAVSRKEDVDLHLEHHCDVPSKLAKIMKESSSNRCSIQHFESSEFTVSSKISKKRRKNVAKVAKESLPWHYNIESTTLAPLKDAIFIGISDKIKAAAALGRRTPAGSAKQRRQVHASAKKEMTQGNEVVSGPEARSVETGGYRRDAVVRVPAKKHVGGRMMTDWVRRTGIHYELARKMRDCTENKLNQKQKKITEQQRDSVEQDRGKMIGVIRLSGKWPRVPRKSSDRQATKEKPGLQDQPIKRSHENKERINHRRIPMKWRRFIRTRNQFIRNEDYGTDMKHQQPLWNLLHDRLENHQEKATGSHQFNMAFREKAIDDFHRKRNFKKLRWHRFFSLFNCISSQTQRAGVTVPNHYPGDRTPHLVGTESIVILDDRAETLRVISSAAKVCVGRHNETPNHFLKF